jgi:hypothetical protein
MPMETGPNFKTHARYWPRNELVLGEIKDRLTTRKDKYDRRHPQPSPLPSVVRRRLGRWECYLEVWDRRNRREKFLSIAADLFGSSPKDEQRAKHNFDRAQALIDGGYKELR